MRALSLRIEIWCAWRRFLHLFGIHTPYKDPKYTDECWICHKAIPQRIDLSKELPQATNTALVDLDQPRRDKGTIGLLNDAKILRIVRSIPPQYMQSYREHKGEGILAETLYIQTDKGTLQVKSCNSCDTLFVKVEKGVTYAFEDLDFKTQKETTQ